MLFLRSLVLVLAVVGVARHADAARRDVLLVVNRQSPDGTIVADAYRAARDVPASHVVSIDVPAGDIISRADYLARVQAPVAEWLHRHAAQDEVVYIVLTRGVPLKVAANGPAMAPLVSVDSSLALLYRVMTGTVVLPGQTLNPYYTAAPSAQGWPAFDRLVHDTYIVSRLDGFTVDDAVALARRCPATAPAQGLIVLDVVPPGVTPEHGWFTEAAERVRVLTPTTHVAVELDQTRERVQGRDGVVGYYSWGAGDPSQRVRTVPFTLSAGAIGASLSASDARTTKLPADTWLPGAWRQADRVFEGTADGLAADMIRGGFTGWAGSVADPLIESLVRPQILFPAYLSGRSLGEAYALATRHLGWRTIVFGDPLCRPFGREPAAVTYTRDERSGLTTPFRDRVIANIVRSAPHAPEASIAVQVAARARVQQGERERGLQLLRDRIATAPDDVQVLQVLSVLLDPVKEREEAIGVYRGVLALRPDDIVASNNLAYVLAEDAAHREEAVTLARRAYERSRGEPTVADTYGWVLYHTGDVPQAIRVLQEAVRRAPGLAEGHVHLALAYLRNGQTPDARTAWATARQLIPAVRERPEAAALVAAFPEP